METVGLTSYNPLIFDIRSIKVEMLQHPRGGTEDL